MGRCHGDVVARWRDIQATWLHLQSRNRSRGHRVTCKDSYITGNVDTLKCLPVLAEVAVADVDAPADDATKDKSAGGSVAVFASSWPSSPTSCAAVPVAVLASNWPSSPTSCVIPAYSMSWDMAAVERLATEVGRDASGGGTMDVAVMGAWSA